MLNRLDEELSATELAALDRLLGESPGAMPLPRARGLLTAVAVAPGLIMPSAWQPLLLGDGSFESLDQVQRIVGLVMRLYNQIVRTINDGHSVRFDAFDDARHAGRDPATDPSLRLRPASRRTRRPCSKQGWPQ